MRIIKCDARNVFCSNLRGDSRLEFAVCSASRDARLPAAPDTMQDAVVNGLR